MSKRANLHYKEILKHLNKFQKEARLPLVTSILLFRGREDVVRRESYDVFTKKNRLRKSDERALIQEAKNILAEINKS